VNSHLLKLLAPAALLSAVVVALTVGVSLAQAATTSGRNAGFNVPAASHSGTNVGLAVLGFAILAVIIGGIAYAVYADRRELTSAIPAVEPSKLSGERSEADHQRKAA
jgi:hypothetical protein